MKSLKTTPMTMEYKNHPTIKSGAKVINMKYAKIILAFILNNGYQKAVE